MRFTTSGTVYELEAIVDVWVLPGAPVVETEEGS